MSWHSQILQYIPFVAVIPHEGCILLDHVQYYKKLLKNQKFRNLLRIFSLASDRRDISQAGEKILLFLLGRRVKLLMSFVYINVMRKFQDRLDTPSKLKLVDPLQMLLISMCFEYIIRYISMCFDYIIRYRSGEGTMCWITLKGLTADKMRNNADRNVAPNK